jgi:hypothetical protein
VARDAADPHGAGQVRLRVRLDAAARLSLRNGRSLRLTLVVRQGDRRATQLLTVRMPGTP